MLKPNPVLTPDGMKLIESLMLNLVAAYINISFDGWDMVLKIMNGYPAECLKTVRCSIDGLKLVGMSWPPSGNWGDTGMTSQL